MEITGMCRVTMHFDVSLTSGEVLQSTSDGPPLEFEYGQGQLLPGLEKRLEGMSDGDEKKIVVPPEDGYGMPNPEALVTVPRSEVPVEGPLEPGMIFQLQTPTGELMMASLVELTEDEVTLDMNHPLAGETLHFNVKIEKVEQSQGPVSCGCGGNAPNPCGCEGEPTDDCGCC